MIDTFSEEEGKEFPVSIQSNKSPDDPRLGNDIG
jgi:hypothetical protein